MLHRQLNVVIIESILIVAEIEEKKKSSTRSYKWTKFLPFQSFELDISVQESILKWNNNRNKTKQSVGCITVNIIWNMATFVLHISNELFILHTTISICFRWNFTQRQRNERIGRRAADGQWDEFDHEKVLSD